MKRILIFLSLALLMNGCGFRKNLVTMSSSRNATDSAAFLEVQKTIQARCTQCHASFPSYTEAQWINLNYVVPGDLANSKLYSSLRGSNVAGRQDMPQDGILSADQLAAIASWIEALKPGNPPPDLIPPTSTDAAVAILTRECQSCHMTAQSATSPTYSGAMVPSFGNFTDASQFVNAGLVLPGNAKDSWLIQSLSGYGDISTMPLNGSPLSQSDYDTLINWINGL